MLLYETRLRNNLQFIFFIILREKYLSLQRREGGGGGFLNSFLSWSSLFCNSVQNIANLVLEFKGASCYEDLN